MATGEEGAGILERLVAARQADRLMSLGHVLEFGIGGDCPFEEVLKTPVANDAEGVPYELDGSLFDRSLRKSGLPPDDDLEERRVA